MVRQEAEVQDEPRSPKAEVERRLECRREAATADRSKAHTHKAEGGEDSLDAAVRGAEQVAPAIGVGDTVDYDQRDGYVRRNQGQGEENATR